MGVFVSKKIPVAEIVEETLISPENIKFIESKTLRDRMNAAERETIEKANKWVRRCFDLKIKELEKDLVETAASGKRRTIAWLHIANDVKCAEEPSIPSHKLIEQFEKVGVPMIIEHLERNQLTCRVIHKMHPVIHDARKKMRLTMEITW